MRTSIFFDYEGKAYFARSTTSSRWSSYTGNNGYTSSGRNGSNPNELCGDMAGKILLYLQDVLGPAKQPPHTKKETVNQAWDITRSRAGFCQYDYADCVSRADVLTTKAVFENAGKEISAVFKLVRAWSTTSRGRFATYTTYTRVDLCEVIIEGML